MAYQAGSGSVYHQLRLRHHRAQLAFGIANLGLPDVRAAAAVQRHAVAGDRAATGAPRMNLVLESVVVVLWPLARLITVPTAPSVSAKAI